MDLVQTDILSFYATALSWKSKDTFFSIKKEGKQKRDSEKVVRIMFQKM